MADDTNAQAQLATLAQTAQAAASTGYDPETRRVDNMSFQLGAASAYAASETILATELARLLGLFQAGNLSATDFGIASDAA
jgi:hypothetical protein